MKKAYAQLKEYVIKGRSENASNHHVYPFFQKIFPKDKFKRESEAAGCDIYIVGILAVELKTHEAEWLQGFFQVLHYNKKGLSFSAVSVITNNFIGLWRLADLPSEVTAIILNTDANKSANEVGKINANKCNKALKQKILDCVYFSYNKEQPLFIDAKLYEFEEKLQHLDVLRNQINPNNFLRKIGLLNNYFNDPIKAIHCFYTMLPFWDTTSKIPDARVSEQNILWLNCKNGSKASESFEVEAKYHKDFRKFVESHYVFTNDADGISIDYYFSRLDEVLAEHNPEYVKQHGIFFTDINLSRFALWFIREKYGEKKLSDKYIVIDPAGGSGNLVSSWRRNHLKYKIISEINPDLLRTIELRLTHDPVQIQQGYSIIPKISENKGLNFIDKSASDYYNIINSYLEAEGKVIDKTFAFLLNPPYKNTKENECFRKATNSNYSINEDLSKFAGGEAEKERYLAFLSQIVGISNLQVGRNPDFVPIIMIFTPTAWLLPRKPYVKFRNNFDKYFKYEKGFIINGNEYFRDIGCFPIAFTIWRYNFKKSGNHNNIIVYDYTHLINKDLIINWESSLETLNSKINAMLRGSKIINLSHNIDHIRDWSKLVFYDFIRDPTKSEIKSNKIYGGLPLKDARRKDNKKTYGIPNATYIGFMDNCTPVRVKVKDDIRFQKGSESHVWFRLDTSFKDINKSKIFSGPSDTRSYCAHNLDTAKKAFIWYSIAKTLVGKYPIWANQFELWKPNVPEQADSYFSSLCFSNGLSENRCVVTKFEKDNPVKGAPEIFVDNPLCPTNPDSFWSTTLDSEVKESLAKKLVNEIKSLYGYWNSEYCKGQFLNNVGLHDEPYFRYFDYPDYVTPYSGLIQIRKYAEINGKTDILSRFEVIKELTKQVKESIYDLLVNKFEYFK